MGLAEILFVVFLVLKLAEIGPVADWSWWAVTAPLWVSFLITLPLVILGAVKTSSASKRFNAEFDKSFNSTRFR